MELIANQMTAAVLLAVGVAAGLIWQQVPEPEAPQPARAAAEEWDLPAGTGKNIEADLKKSADAVLSRNLWGVVAAAADPSALTDLTDPPWRFVGVLRNGAERYVLIKIGNKPVANLKVGDALPGGSKILDIGEDRLCVLVNGKKRALEIYRQ